METEEGVISPGSLSNFMLRIQVERLMTSVIAFVSGLIGCVARQIVRRC